MKKVLWLSFSISMLAILIALTLAFGGCINVRDLPEIREEAKGDLNLPFYVHSMGVPDFLTEEQQNLYRRAFVVYSGFWHGTDGTDYFLLRKDQDESDLREVLPAGETYEPDVVINEVEYIESYGRYRAWEDFENVNLSVFTPGYLKELNKVKTGGKEYEQFIKLGGSVYYVYFKIEKRAGYAGIDKDIFELISEDGDEIKFNLIAHCIEKDSENLIAQPPMEIILTNTEDGWRFTKFNVGW